MTSNASLRVAVLYGGTSDEREVSIDSGSAVFKAIQNLYKRVELVDVTPDFSSKIPYLKSEFDVCFMALHGGEGEDGTIQSLLDKNQICYTGSGPESCRLTMNKIATKLKLLEHQIPTAKMVNLTGSSQKDHELIMAEMGYPVFIKPISGGSSVGLYKVHDFNELSKIKINDTFFAEQAIIGREFTIAVLGTQVLPMIEIKSKTGVYDYEAKYKVDTTEYLFGSVSELLERQMQQVALDVFQICNAREISRIDFLLDQDNHYYVLELNSLPGMTSHSLLPKAAQKIGLDFSGLCNRVLELALERKK